MLIAIGGKHPLFNEAIEKVKGTDGGVLEALNDDYGLWFNIMVNRPQAYEIKTVETRTISVRLLKEDGFVLPMIRFGNTIMIYEMSFDPTMYPDARVFQINTTNNMLFISLIDSSNGIIKAMRAGNLPKKFIQICTNVWAKAFLQPNYSEKYATWYQGLQRQSLERLWQKADYVGKLGETYDLQEVNYHPNSQQYQR